jgi:hypothetical protein
MLRADPEGALRVRLTLRVRGFLHVCSFLGMPSATIRWDLNPCRKFEAF